MHISYGFVPGGETFKCSTFEYLTQLDNYHNIVYINCQNNDLKVLPTLPYSLQHLTWSICKLTLLPTLPKGLKYLDCSNNDLKVLPTLPNSLKYLYCYCNKLHELPNLPNSLIFISCSYNKLHELPNLPDMLECLYCSNNNLILLPNLPNSLTYLDCSNNFLAFLPKLHGSIYYNDNPVRKYIKDICANKLDIYHRENNIFATKLVRWYLNCRENPKFKFCRTRLNREYDALMDDDVGGIMC